MKRKQEARNESTKRDLEKRGGGGEENHVVGRKTHRDEKEEEGGTLWGGDWRAGVSVRGMGEDRDSVMGKWECHIICRVVVLG